MRLLETSPSSIPKLREFIGSHIPPYAILSHTWEDDEVTLQQLTAAGTIDPSPLQSKAGFHKIQQTCALAHAQGKLEYAWVDTCCIDKTSSAELTEAINSMFAWYRDAEVCYVFLSDLQPGAAGDLQYTLPKCRWFTRGWTLQEMIAPKEVLFFDREWNYRGSKKDLSRLISTISGIPEPLLRQEAELCDYTVARRMSWAATRETTRVEDLAYCLLGIFDVNMSLIYGEGMKAFGRLQAAIVQTTADLSIFAWADDQDPCPQYAAMLAESPRQFARCGDIEVAPGDSAYSSFAITTRGIQTEASLLWVRGYQGESMTVILDTRCYAGGNMLGVCVRKIAGALYARCKPSARVLLGRSYTASQLMGFRRSLVEPLTLTTKLPSRYPFHPGLDPILGNRWSALRVNWGPLNLQVAQPLPSSHWDDHDEVLFSPNNGTRGWSAFFVDAWLVNAGQPSTLHARLSLLLACFQWNQGTPLVVLADLDSVDTATRVFLRSHLENIKFESNRRAESAVRDIFETKLQYEVVATEAGTVPYLRDCRIPVTVSLRKEFRADICARPITVLDLALNTTAPRTPEELAVGTSNASPHLDSPVWPPARQFRWQSWPHPLSK